MPTYTANGPFQNRPKHPGKVLLWIVGVTFLLFAVIPPLFVSDINRKLAMSHRGSELFLGALPIDIVIWLLWMAGSAYWRSANRQS